MKRKDPTSIGDILNVLKQDEQLRKHFEWAAVWERWEEIAGPRLAGHGRPKTVRDNTLYIEADSAVWMHRFGFQKWELIKRVNRISGRDLVSDVFIVLRDEDAT